jgi:hypothetical protein
VNFINANNGAEVFDDVAHLDRLGGLALEERCAHAPKIRKQLAYASEKITFF